MHPLLTYPFVGKRTQPSTTSCGLLRQNVLHRDDPVVVVRSPFRYGFIQTEKQWQPDTLDHLVDWSI